MHYIFTANAIFIKKDHHLWNPPPLSGRRPEPHWDSFRSPPPEPLCVESK